MNRRQWDARVELVCINLGESAAPRAKKFLKNLPHLPQVPRSKLGRRRSSFGVCGSLAILNLPRICRTCRICPTLGRFGIFGDQPEALKHSAAVALLRLDCEDVPRSVLDWEYQCAVGRDRVAVITNECQVRSNRVQQSKDPGGQPSFDRLPPQRICYRTNGCGRDARAPKMAPTNLGQVP